MARISLSREQSFSYLHHEEIPPGTLVNIPLFRRNIQGIVLQSRSDFERLGNFKLKKVISIVQESCLTSKQLQLAKFISSYYLSSLGIALRHFIPTPTKQRRLSESKSTSVINQQSKINLTSEQKEAVKKIIFTKTYALKPKPYLLFGPASSGKTEVYLEAIKQINSTSPTSQFLILLPELTLTPQAVERYGERFDKNDIVFINSKLSKGELYTNWEKIRSGEAKIIIGTRMSIFAPFKNLELIVIDEEQDVSFKQWDMNPRYDARTVALKLAEIFEAKIIFGSATPRIDTYYKALQGEYILLELPKLILDNKSRNADIEMIDMRKEKWTSFDGKKKANYSFLSTTLQNEILYALRNKLQSILFINHQGMSSFSTCKKCKAVFLCPKCHRALVYNKSGEYSCLHCAYKSGIFAKCKECGGTEFKNTGVGTSSVEREVKKFFPQAKVCSMDTASSKKPGAFQKLYDDFSQGRIDILVGTQMITKNWDFPNVGLVGIVKADSLFSMPDYLTDEQAFSHIMQAIGRTGRVGSKFPGKALIQTFDPFKFAIKAASEMNYRLFYDKVISQREDLSYPPFGKIVKIVFQHTDIEKVEKGAQKVYEDLVSLISEISPKPRIIGPIDPLVSSVRGRSKKQIIIKLPNQKEIPENIRKLLEKLPSEWIIDVDPIGIA